MKSDQAGASENHSHLLKFDLTTPAAAFDLLQPLILVLDLYRHAIVEALELAAESRYHLAGLLDLGTELAQALDDITSDFAVEGWYLGTAAIGWRAYRTANVGLRTGDLLAKFYSRLAQGFVEADHLGAEIRAQRIDAGPVLPDLIGDEADLAADLGKLAENLILQFVDFSAEARHGLDHQLEAGAQLLEHRP